MSSDNQGRSLRTKFQMLKREELKRDLTGLERDSNGITDDPKLDTSMTYAELLEMVDLLQTNLARSLGGMLEAREIVGLSLPYMVKLRNERDAARRWLCSVLAKPEFVTGLAKPGDGTKYAFAKEQGWDCFEETK